MTIESFLLPKIDKFSPRNSESIQKLSVCLYSVNMRKPIAIVFLFLYLSVNTELHQVFRLPVFFAHYYEHKKENENINIFNFIALHYSSNAVQHDDHDQELPFKKNHCTAASISFVIPPDGFPEPIIISFPIVKSVVPISQQFNSSSFHLTIWQPPKVS